MPSMEKSQERQPRYKYRIIRLKKETWNGGVDCKLARSGEMSGRWWSEVDG